MKLTRGGWALGRKSAWIFSTMALLLDLLRHADARSKTPDGSDHDRTLSLLGQRQVLLLAEHIREQGGYPVRVWCSTATRTHQTLSGLGYDFTSITTYDVRLYEAELETLLELIGEIRPLANRVLLVGHNPGLQDLMTYLAGPDTPTMITAAHARLVIPEKPDRPLRGKGKLLGFWAP
jgi:phosphohistidine phosphatase